MTLRAAQDSSPPRRARLGVALSGGGFRASLFHIGVLARLAELDLLREVQVLSTVSGGSIIGALYYLHARALLESKSDRAITREDYISLVDRLWRDFTVAIQQNLRMRAFGDWGKNLRMLFDPRYSRSDRLAELYEQYLYAPLLGIKAPGRVALPKLLIRPHGEPPGFKPLRGRGDAPDAATGNDGRRNKVPVLVLNATTLNTGHAFQFTASWMGEPQSPEYHAALDCNLWLCPAYYRDLQEKYRELPLGVAVAASAAVPGLFPPLALTDLYEDRDGRVTPQLVDGGVHDNQGLAALLDPDNPCTHLIVSDASGQMDDVPDPPTVVSTVIRRSNEVLMDRVREEEYAATRLREQCGDVTRLVFMHLKEGIPRRRLVARGAERPSEPQEVNARTAHGVDARVQTLLAGMRTDLDAFTEIEAYALMADGYLIARHHLNEETWRALDTELRPGADSGAVPPCEHPWEFRDIEPVLADPGEDSILVRHLDAGSRLVGKSFLVVPVLQWLSAPWLRYVAAALLLAGGAAAVANLSPERQSKPPVDATPLTWFDMLRPWLEMLWPLGMVLLLVLGLILPWAVRAWAQSTRRTVVERGARVLQTIYPGLISASLCWLGVGRHLAVLTPLRLDEGRIARLLGRTPHAPETPAPDQEAA